MKWDTFVSLLVIQWVDRGPCLAYPELQLGPIIMLRKKVEIYNPVWHSGQNRATCPEITRIGVACVPFGIHGIFFVNSECSWYGLSVPVYGGCAKMCTVFELEGFKSMKM